MAVPATPPTALEAADSSLKKRTRLIASPLPGQTSPPHISLIAELAGEVPKSLPPDTLSRCCFWMITTIAKAKGPSPLCAFDVDGASSTCPAVYKEVPNWGLCCCTVFLHTTMQKCSSLKNTCSSSSTSSPPLSSKEYHFQISCNVTHQSPG